MGLFDLVDVGLCQWWIFSGACGFMPVMDVGLCRWWVCFVGLFDLVDVWCWMWVCLVWWMVCTDLSGCFFFFFFRCAAVVVGGRCCRMVVGPGLVMKMIMIVIGIGRRKYIILLCSKHYFNV